MRLQVLMFYQDDPKKCTAAKMVRFGLAKDIRRIGGRALVLDPFSETFLLPGDRNSASSVVGIDCSWSLAEQAFSDGFGGIRRALPPLLAGNPVNYAKIGRLSTAEALSACLIIMGFRQQGLELLAKFKWGHTFYDLNRNILGDYAAAESEDDIHSIMRDYNLA